MSEVSNAPEVRDWLKSNGIHTVRVGTVDIDGLWRGKRIPARYFAESVWTKGTNLANILFGWDVTDDLLPGLKYTGWQTGYPDFNIRPDLSTLTTVPWEPGAASVMCDPYEFDGSAVGLSPRHLLRRAVQQVTDLGYTAAAAYELEFYLLDSSTSDIRSRGFRDLKPVTEGNHTYSLQRGNATEYVLAEIREKLAEAGVYIEACNTEHGPGQFEVNIRYGDPLQAADHAVMLKTGVREIAAQHGLTATFMAKIHPDWAGSSGHMHQSLTDASGEPLFASAGGKELSDTGRHYLAGLVSLARELSALYLPNTNSYKRSEAVGSWAGANATWGTDNRTVAVRAIPSTGHPARVENRLAGADANPYLVIAASLWSGLHGIKNSLEPGDAVTGNAYELPYDASKALPSTLGAALDLFEGSSAARDFFGEQFVEHYTATRRWEITKSNRAVTDWELGRFLELI